MTAPTTSTVVLTCVSGWQITTSCAIRYVPVLYFVLLFFALSVAVFPTHPVLDTLSRSSIGSSAGKPKVSLQLETVFKTFNRTANPAFLAEVRR